ncbi:MAG: hypothetical protein VXW32_09005 [Myxococcota bacterium]|nr:hypothetical protein [Myxococcota bacterium]
MHPDTEHIVALHKCDLRCETLQKDIRSLLQEVEGAARQVQDAESLLSKEQAALRELQSKEEACTRRYERYLDKAENTRKLLESGQASNYEAAQTQLEQCLEIADSEETALLELMEEIEEASERIASRERQLSLRQDQHQNRVEARNQRLPALEQELALARSQRTRKAADLREDHLSLYEQLRKKLRHAVSSIHEDACTACGMVVSSMPLAEHRRGSVVHRCRNCGRFLGEFL